MALAFVKSAVGTSASATPAWAFGSATTSGNLIVGAFAADDYNASPTSGWTESAEMRQEFFHGSYIWWRISAGETTPQAYSIGSATNSAWILAEFSGNHATPYDISQSIGANETTEIQVTDNIVPTAGQRLIVASMTASNAASMAAYTFGTWLNSFTAVTPTGVVGSAGTGSNDFIGLAYRIVTGDNSTVFSTGNTFSGSIQSHCALIIAFKESSGPEVPGPKLQVVSSPLIWR